jgi:uncharacterized OB-fold protein
VTGGTIDYTRAEDRSFTAPLTLFYPYARTVGSTYGRFLTGLRDRRIEGTRLADGRVAVPPVEFDPDTGEPCTEWVEVGTEGTVVTWAWQPEPVDGNPLSSAFAWALVLLDGAGVPMLHAVDTGGPESLTTGARVRVRWADERSGSISDIVCFEPVVTTVDAGPGDVDGAHP